MIAKDFIDKYGISELVNRMKCMQIPDSCNGQINQIYSSRLTLEQIINQLYWICYNIGMSQSDLLKFVSEYFEDIDATIKEEIEKVLTDDGYYLDVVIPKLEDVINNNLQLFVSKIAKQVYFGLTDSGYFYAFVPGSWDGVTFSTTTEEDEQGYGHLVLKY